MFLLVRSFRHELWKNLFSIRCRKKYRGRTQEGRTQETE